MRTKDSTKKRSAERLFVLFFVFLVIMALSSLVWFEKKKSPPLSSLLARIKKKERK